MSSNDLIANQGDENKCEGSLPSINDIPVISNDRSSSVCDSEERGSKVIKTIKMVKRSVLKAASLPTVINCNPRSAYGKQEELKILIQQYNCQILTLSESWNREDFPLHKLIEIENYRVITISE